MFEKLDYEITLGDALETMGKLDENSVDLIFVDLPYGVTKNKWDSIIPFEELWNQFNRVKKITTPIILTATQPFSSMLIISNLKQFKYELIWAKTICSGQLNVKHQPLRAHESILIFYDKIPTYNEQKTTGKPYKISRNAEYSEHNYSSQKPSVKENDGFRHAKSVLNISNPRIKNGHPTQKPDELLQLLIKTYSNPDDIVLDCCMGSGSTGVAALKLGRKFIGVEKELRYFEMAKKNLEGLMNE